MKSVPFCHAIPQPNTITMTATAPFNKDCHQSFIISSQKRAIKKKNDNNDLGAENDG
jgi:hypothetical protein